jgi:hypothetical protein
MFMGQNLVVISTGGWEQGAPWPPPTPQCNFLKVKHPVTLKIPSIPKWLIYSFMPLGVFLPNPQFTPPKVPLRQVCSCYLSRDATRDFRFLWILGTPDRQVWPFVRAIRSQSFIGNTTMYNVEQTASKAPTNDWHVVSSPHMSWPLQWPEQNPTYRGGGVNQFVLT